MNKQYVGDGVYVEYDGYGFVLTTENGHEVTNRIVLEPEVWESLKRYVNAQVTDMNDPPPRTSFELIMACIGKMLESQEAGDIVRLALALYATGADVMWPGRTNAAIEHAAYELRRLLGPDRSQDGQP